MDWWTLQTVGREIELSFLYFTYRDSTFVLILANIKMNIKIYWPQTNILEQKINILYFTKLKIYILFIYCQYI